VFEELCERLEYEIDLRWVGWDGWPNCKYIGGLSVAGDRCEGSQLVLAVVQTESYVVQLHGLCTFAIRPCCSLPVHRVSTKEDVLYLEEDFAGRFNT